MFPTGGPPLSDITLKLEEIPKPITFPAIKAEPDELGHRLCAHYWRCVTNIRKRVVSVMISIFTSVQLNKSTMLSGNLSLVLSCVNP